MIDAPRMRKSPSKAMTFRCPKLIIVNNQFNDQQWERSREKNMRGMLF
jgi:hypothetical protein